MHTQSSTYADIEIRIFEPDAQGYPVEISVNSEQQYEGGYLSLNFVEEARYADGRQLLASLLSNDTLKTAWAALRGQYPQRRIRLRISQKAPELHTVPWELLVDTGEGDVPVNLAAASATPFSRYLAGAWRPGGPILKRPLRVLVAIANPANLAAYDLAPIEVEQEWALLRETLAGLAGQVELTLLPQPCTLAEIEKTLRQGKHHVLHFIGHGKFSQQRQEARLFMADQNNQVALVSDAELAGMLARQLADMATPPDDKLRLVFLASCQSATRSLAEVMHGLAPRLVAAGVPAVIGMQDLVTVETAREFGRTFYSQLLRHGQVDLACNEARSAILTADLSGASIPVLFMRLRSGLLLGQRGYIASRKADTFWPFLLRKIYDRQCIPILGPRVNEGLLPDSTAVADRLAERYGYPLADRTNLIKVAQFMATKDPQALRRDYLQLLQRSLFRYLGLKPTDQEKQRFRNTGLTETARSLGWAEKALQLYENQVHHLLAQLELPLYITTNVDSFMAEALAYHLRQKVENGSRPATSPRRIGPRWEQAQAGSPQYILLPEPDPEKPVVLHLNGFEGDPEQERRMVLSEDDFLAHLVRIARDQDAILPSNLLGDIFHQNSFLFLGYNLDDWEFRLILHGFVEKGSAELHVGVQLADTDVANPDKACEYLEDYFGKYNVDIYWGAPQQFVTELSARWQEYLKEVEQDGWD